MISIIIPNYNSPVIGGTISSLLDQNYNKPFEILIIGRDKYNLVSKFKDKRVRAINTPKRAGPSEGRNIGVKAARGGTILFLDADCIAPRGWISSLVSQKYPIVVGSMELKSTSFWKSCDNFIHFNNISRDLRSGATNLVCTNNMKIPKNCLLEVGGFDEKLITGEDLDLSLNLKDNGHRFYFNNKSYVYHIPIRGSFSDILMHSYSWGKNSMPVRMKHMGKSHLKFLFNANYILFIAPFASLYLTFKTFSRPMNMKYSHFAIFYFISKMAWFMGAYKGLKCRP
ncbi:MAG TPA: glycosyltransferase [Nanoarchaeota archaeon]|nr:glycosyltransferase [Nanoarchaeota archaeon]